MILQCPFLASCSNQIVADVSGACYNLGSQNLSKGTIALINVSDVTGITEDGFRLLAENKEYFVSFAEYPVFTRATVDQIFAVKRIAPGHYNWTALDADIELDALENPERFPLIYR